MFTDKQKINIELTKTCFKMISDGKSANYCDKFFNGKIPRYVVYSIRGLVMLEKRKKYGTEDQKVTLDNQNEI